MRKFIFELLLLGIAIGLTVEVIKSAVPYLPLIWLAVLCHYTWEAITNQHVLAYANRIKTNLSGRRLMLSYFLVGLFGAVLMLSYWWGLNYFFAPKIAAYEQEQIMAKNSKQSDADKSPSKKDEPKKVDIPISPIPPKEANPDPCARIDPKETEKFSDDHVRYLADELIKCLQTQWGDYHAGIQGIDAVKSNPKHSITDRQLQQRQLGFENDLKALKPSTDDALVLIDRLNKVRRKDENDEGRKDSLQELGGKISDELYKLAHR